jgi:hypothetical protein
VLLADSVYPSLGRPGLSDSVQEAEVLECDTSDTDSDCSSKTDSGVRSMVPHNRHLTRICAVAGDLQMVRASLMPEIDSS